MKEFVSYSTLLKEFEKTIISNGFHELPFDPSEEEQSSFDRLMKKLNLPGNKS
jgi:hypothetical protein